MDTQNDWKKVTMALTMAIFGIYVSIGGGNCSPLFGEDEPNLTSIFVHMGW